jgi:hypothetical protein
MRLTWEHRLLLLLPRSIFAGAFILAVCLSAAYVGFQSFFGFRVELSAFGMGIFLLAVLMAPTYFFDIKNQPQDQTSALLFEIDSDVIRASRLSGAIGVLASAGLWEIIQFSQGKVFLSAWNQFYGGSSITVMFLWLGWLSGRTNYFWFAGIWDKPGPEVSSIDLLNLENLYIDGRGGLKGSFIWFVVIAVAGALILPDVGSGLWIVLLIFAINVAGGLMFLLTPARKTRNLIRQAKKQALNRLEPLLREARDRTLTNSTDTQGRLSDLLAYKNQIVSTNEWPFDSSTILRFCLYLLIPIASMVGGALVERLIESLLS